jgi:hypothetical protein
VVGQLEALRVRVGPALGVPRVFELGPGELAGLVDRDDVSPLGPPSRLVSRLLLGGGLWKSLSGIWSKGMWSTFTPGT